MQHAETNGMQCCKTVHQHYSIIDLPLSGEFTQ